MRTNCPSKHVHHCWNVIFPTETKGISIAIAAGWDSNLKWQETNTGCSNRRNDLKWRSQRTSSSDTILLSHRSSSNARFCSGSTTMTWIPQTIWESQIRHIKQTCALWYNVLAELLLFLKTRWIPVNYGRHTHKLYTCMSIHHNWYPQMRSGKASWRTTEPASMSSSCTCVSSHSKSAAFLGLTRAREGVTCISPPNTVSLAVLLLWRHVSDGAREAWIYSRFERILHRSIYHLKADDGHV